MREKDHPAGALTHPVRISDNRKGAPVSLPDGEGFVAYYSLPLIVKDQMRGTLEIFHREPLDLDPDWLGFLEALAGQTAIAIENASLFVDLQCSNIELALAYDVALEGWVKALDMRDKETEGHTQRVTSWSLQLAQEMGISDDLLPHWRRGALLHDIGKIAIPDLILLKPGPLTEEEWAVMRRHPVYAYDLLFSIDYLHPALDIPYCHHERWDGSGYPRGLKGEEIPLAARIFAVVDVWDALCSERPYCKGWPEEKALEHLRSQAGIHFDPEVVEAFIRLRERIGVISEGRWCPPEVSEIVSPNDYRELKDAQPKQEPIQPSAVQTFNQPKV